MMSECDGDDDETAAPSAARLPARQPPHHCWIDHTGELHLQVEASNLELLFEQAGRALAEVQLERAANDTLGASLRVDLAARDRAALLAAWLNELIFLSEIHKRVFTELQVERVTDVHLTAHVRGVAVASLRTLVKAATMHELSVEETPDGYVASVVLDV